MVHIEAIDMAEAEANEWHDYAPANPAQVTDAYYDSVALEAAREIMTLTRSGVFDDRLKAKIQVRISEAIAAIGAGGQAVAVKPLEWVEHEPNWWGAGPESLGFSYEVRFTDRGTTRIRMPAQHWGIFAGTPDEAKAAAQADFERRILSVLSQPHPADERVVEALEWYAVQVAGCRKVTSEGNDARAALNNDGGKRALAALSAKEGR